MASIVVIAGSVRRDRNGIHVAKWIQKKLEERNHDVNLVDPMELDLPLLDRMYKEPFTQIRLLFQRVEFLITKYYK